MIRLHSMMGVAAVALGLLSACGQTTPPPTPTTEPMRGGALPVGPASAGTGNTAITTEPMRGAPLPTGTARPNAAGSPVGIGTEPMRGGSLPTSTDQRR
ncbi:hypothetical protein EAH89_23635 [Roseomonas nepalensis]|uniref:Uncharacterized protein n=1 Tax=Muricoccus nepalensis TaxID=1854500 RepID=A0A502FDE1_9PROT|nr:hypothetical protein [Roseomonas nepalensis]TPG47299.1 hypothetical protein EAH89_23635 [Roseomonas nepalensis]